MVALLLVFLCLLSQSVDAATYYLNPASGSDGAVGSLASPWKTLFKVKTTVVAGDTVNIIGGSYTQSQVQGEGGTPNWTQSQSRGSAGNLITIQANPGSIVTFDGGGASYWQRFYASASNAGHYVLVQNMNFHNYSAAILGTEGATQSTPVHHVAILNCAFSDIGQLQSAPLFTFNSHHVVYAGNSIVNSGDPSIPGDSLPQNQHGIYIADQSEYVLIENNYVEKTSGFGIHFWNAHSLSNTTRNVIFRKNVVVNSHSSAHIIAGDTYLNIYVYNNTYYNDPIPFPALDSTAGNGALTFHNGGSFTNINLLNNIGYGTWAIDTFVQENSAQHTNLTDDYNLWTNLQSSSRTVKWNSTEYTLAAFQAATSRELHSLTGDPVFMSAAGRNFTLAPGSPAIDTGHVLTTAVGAGSSSTSLTVADAGYFHDGFGLIPGDTIVIGTGVAVSLTSVNYATNVLTLAASRSWSNGDGVTLPYSGSAPEMGAIEFVTPPPPLSPAAFMFLFR